MSLTGAFLRDDEKSWVSSNLFFMCINRLDLNDKVYHIPPGVVVNNEDASYYVSCVIAELNKLTNVPEEQKQDYEYVKYVSTVLNSWVGSGHGIKII